VGGTRRRPRRGRSRQARGGRRRPGRQPRWGRHGSPAVEVAKREVKRGKMGQGDKEGTERQSGLRLRLDIGSQTDIFSMG